MITPPGKCGKMESIINRIRDIKSKQNDIESKFMDKSLTLTELEQLDCEWDILDEELRMHEETLEAATSLTHLWNVPEFEEPEEDLDTRWSEETEHWVRYGSPVFELADEV